MTGLEIALLIIGLAICVASFVFSTKMDGPEQDNSAELTERQRKSIEKQIVDIFDEKMEELSAKQESQMDLMSLNKKKEMDEYSETILNEINRNHNEVMFLYDMLNEKKKEVTNAIRDVNAVRASVENAAKSVTTEETPAPEKKPARKKTAKEKVLDQLDAVADSVSDSVIADEEVITTKTKKTRATGKTAASRAKNTIGRESDRSDKKSVGNLETGNNNEKILELNKAGKSNVEIAKELGIGIGEVKLVIDLFKGGRS